MKSSLLLALLLSAPPASAGDFYYTSFAVIEARCFEKDLAEAKRLKAVLEGFLGSRDSEGFALREGVSHDAFQTARDAFYVALSSAARWHRRHHEVRSLAEWGLNTWVKLDEAIELHSERLVSQTYFDALRLK